MLTDPENTTDKATRRTVIKVLAGAAAAAGGIFLLEPSRLFVRNNRAKVRFWHQLGGEWLDAMNSIIEAFNRSQVAYEIEPLLMSDTEADPKMLLSTVGGEPPDVVLTWTQGTAEWGATGLLQPLDKYMSPEELRWYKNDTYPVVSKSGWYRGKLYGIVMGFDLWVCYYRPDHFRTAGVDPDNFPASLEELVRIGAKMDKISTGGSIERMGFMPTVFRTFAPIFGGGFIDEITGRLTLNTPENLRCLKFLLECRNRLGSDKVLRFESGLPSDDGGSWAFIQGQYSVIAEGEWRVEQLRKYGPEIEYKTIAIPPPKGGKPKSGFSMTNFLMMPKGALQPRGGWEFIKFWAGLGNPVAAAGYYPILGWMPLAPALRNAPVYLSWLNSVPQYKTFLDVASSTHIAITPPVPFQLYLMDQVQKADDSVSQATATPEFALQKLEHDVFHEMSRRKSLGLDE